MNPYRKVCTLMLMLIYMAACKNNQEPHTPILDDLIDKQVLHIHDSVSTAKDPAIVRSNLIMLHQLEKDYPYSKDSASHAVIALDISIHYGTIGQFDTSITYANDALPYFESHPEFQLPLTRCYNLLGMGMKNLYGNIFTANRYSSKAAILSQLPAIASRLGYTRKLQMLFVAAGTNLECAQEAQALKFAKAAYQLLLRTPQDSINSYIHYRVVVEVARAYIQMQQYDSAKKYVDLTENWTIESKMPDGPSKINGLKADYYLATRQYDTCLRYLLDKNNYHPFFALYSKLNVYTLLGNHARATEYFTKAEQMVQEGSSVDDGDNQYYKYRTQYLILYGDRQQAFQSFLAFDSLSRELYSKERLDMYASMEPEYNLAEKQKRLDRLDKANKVAQDEIRQKNTLLLVAILAILLVTLAVVAVLLFSRQRKLRSEKKMLETERNRIALEQRLLRTQMEPHFIFNTLSVLQSQIHNQENEKAGKYLNHFARLLRTSLENSRENFVPLQEEIEALNDYLSLQQMRFENTFDYSVHLYPGFEEDDVQILPMLLQPFVENAIQYGRNGSARLQVTIDIKKEADTLYCIIEDNGGGRYTQEKQLEKKSLSTQIIKERLAIVALQSGKETLLTVNHIDTATTTGTRVTLMFPRLTGAMTQQLGRTPVR